MNSTNAENIDLNCDDADIKFYISLGANALLGFLTLLSEFMAHSKCKANSLTEIPIHLVKQMSRRNIDTNTAEV